ncbi:helix-turn-helix transcriptional regulator [Paenibacillus sp. GCM10023252]|uniref:helix-turn-helix transcriptional regulator n=1 Tax=Paenibacillus sp. GCM10023252 TaxID=3252649 RepID=UPI003608C76D
MSKADSMLAILWILKSRGRVTAKQLAEMLEIHVRTVYRYVDALCASGVPIVSDSGHNGGYSLLKPFTEAPLFFNTEEQKALTHAALFAAESSGYPYGEELSRAVTKLRTYTSVEQLDEINRYMDGFDVISPRVDPQHDATLAQLEQAVARGQTSIIGYLKERDTIIRERLIDPYGMVYWKGKWYVVAHCHGREAMRSFRVDRIHGVAMTEDVFTRPVGFSAKEHLLSSLLDNLSRGGTGKRVTVCLEGHREVMDSISEHWLIGQSVEEKTEDSLRFTLMEEHLYVMIPHYLMTYGRSIRVVEPALLIERMIEMTGRIRGHYEQSLAAAREREQEQKQKRV